MIKYYSIFMCCLWTISSQAQSDSLGMPAEKVEVVKRYEASILQARKKKISFDVEEKTFSPILYNYNVTTEKVIDFERPDPEIRAIGYKGNPVTNPELKDGYIYGAYGTHNTINAGAAYHYYIEDWLDAGFKVDHISAREDQPLLQDSLSSYTSKMSQTQADAYFGYYLSPQTKVTLNGSTKLVNHNTDNSRIDALTTLPIDKYGADLGFSHNVFEEKGFSFRLNGTYDYGIHKTDSDISNQILGARMDVFKSFGDKMSINLPVRYSRLSASTLDTSNTVVSDIIADPNIRYRAQNYTLKAGVQYITGDSASYLFPIIDLTLNAVVAGLDLRLYTASSYSRNSFYQLTESNPYMNASSANYSPNYERSYNLEAIYPYQDFRFSLGFSYSQYDNFVNYFEAQDRRGIAAFIDREEFSIKPSVVYTINEKSSFKLGGRYNIFLTDLDSITTLNYVPTTQIYFEGEQLLLDDKLVLTQNLIYNSARSVTSFLTAIETPDAEAFVDLSAQIKYRISPSFDVFVKGTNLLGADYFVWNNQNVFRQQIWGGLKFRL